MSICFSGIKAKSKCVVITIIPHPSHPLIKLSQVIPWDEIAGLVLPDLRETTPKKLLNVGRRLRLRIHLGVYLLQQMNGLTDRETEWQLKDNAAYQIFCGNGVVDRFTVPDHTKIEEFRSRISSATQCKIANLVATVGVKLGYGDPSTADQDSTVQEAGISYPSDARLLVKMGRSCEKVFNWLLEKFPEIGMEPFNFKKIKAAARQYYFGLKGSIERKKEKFKDLFYTTFLECCKATEMSITTRLADTMPWNIRKAWEQIKLHGKKYFKDVEQFIFSGAMTKGKAMSFHLKELACFNKMKEGKDLQFGRQFQLARLGSNFVIVAECATVRMEDKKSVTPMIELHETLFGCGTLKSYGTDKGYYSKDNQRFLKRRKKIPHVHLQRPGQDLSRLPKNFVRKRSL